jgi:hypothetical protein
MEPKKKNLKAGSPLLATWKNIANLTNKQRTSCRNVIYHLREIHQRHYITHDHVCEYFMITREQYDKCQEEAAEREASQDNESE